MKRWRVIFYPATGKRNSPFDYIQSLPAKESAILVHRLNTVAQLELADWPHSWIHKISDKIFQLTAGPNRILYCLHENHIIVLHACRKKKQKTHIKDIERAEYHYQHYFAQLEGDI